MTVNMAKNANRRNWEMMGFATHLPILRELLSRRNIEVFIMKPVP